MTRFVSCMSVATAHVGFVLLATLSALPSYGQDAPNPVGDFLNAFRGKPVGPVPPPPAVPAYTPQATVPPPSQTPKPSASQYPSAGMQSCPPGVDRLGCPSPYGNKSRNDCPAGMTPGPIGCVPMAMPSNAHRVTSDGQWQCDDGFMRFGAVCMAIQSTPANAHLTGTGTAWECNTGFRRIGNECETVNIPANSHLTNNATGWECDASYQMIGNSCVGH
jgi:hypothetical protein